MKKSRDSESQIVKILKEVEAGKLVKDVCHTRCAVPYNTTNSDPMIHLGDCHRQSML